MYIIHIIYIIFFILSSMLTIVYAYYRLCLLSSMLTIVYAYYRLSLRLLLLRLVLDLDLDLFLVGGVFCWSPPPLFFIRLVLFVLFFLNCLRCVFIDRLTIYII
jgi:hypothetical protein